ncbi:chaplin [Streptomyces sp. MST-110588]|uniref:chaplin n=1 Tax=Streptomyces sp. MST-110588 TaxID=2833628 RepID=UPI001F5C272E|nr:chaplin [Streptomyces sp. MST-110588]UNO41629.1 chaplin [Streptomyces sp. MST-110588]
MKRVSKAIVLSAAAGLAVVGGAGMASATDGGAAAQGVAQHSPGVASGNVVQVPVHVPVNVCGNTINVVGVLNPSHGNVCVNN